MAWRHRLPGRRPHDIDFVVVRENTEDFYVGIGSRFKKHEKTELNVIRDIYSVKFGLDVDERCRGDRLPDRGHHP